MVSFQASGRTDLPSRGRLVQLLDTAVQNELSSWLRPGEIHFLKNPTPLWKESPPIPPKTFSLPRAESGRHRSSLFKGWSCAGGVCLEHLELGSWSDLMFACYGPLYPSVHTRWLFWQWMCLSQNIVFYGFFNGDFIGSNPINFHEFQHLNVVRQSHRSCHSLTHFWASRQSQQRSICAPLAPEPAIRNGGMVILMGFTNECWFTIIFMGSENGILMVIEWWSPFDL